MSGVITLEALNEEHSPVSDEPTRRNRAMTQNHPSLKDEHTGWSDDELFVAALHSPAFVIFDCEIDEALGSLIRRWSVHAAPNAQGVRRPSKFPSAKPVNKPK
jgi:hypothetical protein